MVVLCHSMKYSWIWVVYQSLIRWQHWRPGSQDEILTLDFCSACHSKSQSYFGRQRFDCCYQNDLCNLWRSVNRQSHRILGSNSLCVSTEQKGCAMHVGLRGSKESVIVAEIRANA